MAKTVRKYRGRQRALIRSALRRVGQLISDRARHADVPGQPDTAICDSATATAHLNPLHDYLMARLLDEKTV